MPEPMNPAPTTPRSATSPAATCWRGASPAWAVAMSGGRLPLHGRHLALPQLDAPDLAGERLRQVVDELDPARVGVRRQPVADEVLDVLGHVVAGLVALGEHDERLDHVAALLVGRGHGGGLAHRRVLQAGRLDLEGTDAIAGGDDHVVGAPGVPDVAVLVLHRGVLGVEPLAAEVRLGVLRAVPVAERVVRVGARAQADLPALALW